MQGTSRAMLVTGSLFLFAGGCIPVGSDGKSVEEQSSAASYKVNGITFTNATGSLRTYSDNKKVSFKPHKVANAEFFQAIGTNGRACIHCHLPDEGWTITPAVVQYRFQHPLDINNPD